MAREKGGVMDPKEARRDGVGRQRAANIDSARIEAIVGTIASLPERPTWAAVVEGLEAKHGWRYTRQALSSHERIRLAVQNRRHGRQADGGGRPISARAKAQADDRSRLLAELRVKDALAERLTARFLVWAFNAFKHGLLESDLDKPIPSADEG